MYEDEPMTGGYQNGGVPAPYIPENKTDLSQVNAELFAAMAKARKSFEKTVPDKDNPFFSSAYVSLAGIQDATVEALSANGLGIMQFPTTSENCITVKTILYHASGACIESVISIPENTMQKKGVLGVQEIAGGFTYLKRYAQEALLNVSKMEDDDDGNSLQRGGTIYANKNNEKVGPAKKTAPNKEQKSEGAKASNPPTKNPNSFNPKQANFRKLEEMVKKLVEVEDSRKLKDELEKFNEQAKSYKKHHGGNEVDDKKIDEWRAVSARMKVKLERMALDAS